MASVIMTTKGFKLTDKVDFTGKAYPELECALNYEVSIEAGYSSSESFYDKFVAYFAQEATQSWMSASKKVSKLLEKDFKIANEAMKSYRTKVVGPCNAKAEKLLKDYSNKLGLEEKFKTAILAELGKKFINEAQTKALKRFDKEGNKLKASKWKIALSVMKVVLSAGAIAAAAVVAVGATAVSGGAALALLVPIAVWIGVAGKAAKNATNMAKEINSLFTKSKNHVDQLELMIAEIDILLVKAVKYSGNLEAEADLMDLKAADLAKALDISVKSAKEINPIGSLSKDKVELEAEQTKLYKALMIAKQDRSALRTYNEDLKKALVSFRTVKTGAKWTTKIASSKSAASLISKFTTIFDKLVEKVDALKA